MSCFWVEPHQANCSRNVYVNPPALWSKPTLQYWMMVDIIPNLKEEVGGSIPGCEIFSLFDKKNLSGDQLPIMLWHWHVGLLSLKNKKKKEKNTFHSLVLWLKFIPIRLCWTGLGYSNFHLGLTYYVHEASNWENWVWTRVGFLCIGPHEV